jgi:WD40 repeat protein
MAAGDTTVGSTPANPIVLRGHDNRWVVTGSDDKTVRLWLLQVNDLVNLAHTSLGRNFFAEEWQLYFPGQRYRKTFPDLLGPD